MVSLIKFNKCYLFNKNSYERTNYYDNITKKLLSFQFQLKLRRLIITLNISIIFEKKNITR